MDIKKISLNNTSYDIRDSRVTTNVVNGNAAWSAANSITITNAASGNVIKQSGVSIATSLGSDNTTVPTSLAVKNAIDALPAPMVFKGSLGTGGTITTLPTASASNIGYTYKVITAGTYASQAAKVGDTFISDGSSWVLIPSGDEPSGTVTSIATGNGLTGGPITSSGTISLDTQYVKNQTYEDFKAGGGLLVQYHSDNYGNMQDVTYSLSTATASLLGGIKVGSGLSVTSDGTLSANISGKADKVSGATNGNLAALDSNGNLVDSGKSISTTAVSTATHFLATNSSTSSIAPITTANLASVLGAPYDSSNTSVTTGDMNDYTTPRCFIGDNRTSVGNIQNFPVTATGIVRVTAKSQNGYSICQDVYVEDGSIYSRSKWGNSWTAWRRVDNFGCNTPADLASALGAARVHGFPSQSHENTYYKVSVSGNRYNFCVYCCFSNSTGSMYSISRDLTGFALSKTLNGASGMVFYKDSNNDLYIKSQYGGNKWILPLAGDVTSIVEQSTTPSGITEIVPQDASYLSSYSSLSSLASALGGTVTRVTDLSVPPSEKGVLYLDGAISNGPFTFTYGSSGIFLGGAYPLCIVSAKDANGQYMYARLANQAGTAWATNSQWERISLNVPTFLNSYASLSSLATAIGATYWYDNETNADLDNKTTPQTVQYWSPSTGVVTVIVHTDNAGHLSQTKITRDSLYYRYKWSGAWVGWYKVTPTKKSDDELLVDLGLPSGNLWATRNVDVTRQNGFAASPYQYECSFFSWGNTDGHNPISSSAFSYDWGSSNSGTYASTHGSTLTADVGLDNDFGRFNLGGEWRLPTTGDFVELFDSNYTKFVNANGTEISGTNKTITMNGVTGIRLMSKVNGKTIFFPCSGGGDETSWFSQGTYGVYWSSSLNSAAQGIGLSLSSSGVNPEYFIDRYFGFPCRPVASKSYKDVYPTLSGLASALGCTKLTINKTWSELKAMRDGGTLVPGLWYRITDYVTTTKLTYTQSAEHAFDIIVRADDASTLNENAHAAKHAGDTYFADSNLAAWELKYNLDNIRWSLVKDKVTTLTYNGTTYNLLYNGEVSIQGTSYYEWKTQNNISPYPVNVCYTESLTSGALAKVYLGSFSNLSNIGDILESGTEGKGTITFLRDENFNQCDYDFKNIMFARRQIINDSGYDYLTNIISSSFPYVCDPTGRPHGVVLSQLVTDTRYLYTFTYRSNDFVDASLSRAICRNNTVMSVSEEGLPRNVFYLIGYGKMHHVFLKGIRYSTFLCSGESYNVTFDGSGDCNIINMGYNISVHGQLQSSAINSINYTLLRGFVASIAAKYLNSCDINYCSSCDLKADLYRTFISNSSSMIIEKLCDGVEIKNSSHFRLRTLVSNTHALKNIKIESIHGTSSNYKDIVHPTTEDAFLTEYKPTGSQVINV